MPKFPQIAANVAIEVADGDFVGTTQVARDNHLKISTIFRWISKGLPGADGGRVRLEAVRRGRKWLTSRAAIRRFFAALPSVAASDSTAKCIELSQQALEKRHQEVKKNLEQKYRI